MKTTAVICEYNPFHKGHKLQLDGIKQKNSRVICIMSGGFVQRGSPAVFDKYLRAEAAVRSGADLVLELPYPYCCSAAEHFAFGGVSIADGLGVVDELCFGSECGDVSLLEKASERLTSGEFLSRLNLARKDKAYKDTPYAALRETVYKQLYGEDLPTRPNDILGIEYISALKKICSPLIPVTYKREKGFSATESRRLIAEENSFDMLPADIAPIFETADRYSLEYAEKAILAFYRTASPEALKLLEGMTDGIADRLIKNASDSVTLRELCEKTSGKSYTNAKIRRCIIHGMTGVTHERLKTPPLFTRVLACGKGGRELVRRISREGKTTLITKPAHFKRLEPKAKEQALFCNRADALLTLMCEKTKTADEFLKKSPFISE